MNKRLGYALALMALTAIVLVLNRGKVDIELGFTSVELLKGIAFLLFTGLGVAIGLLLK